MKRAVAAVLVIAAAVCGFVLWPRPPALHEPASVADLARRIDRVVRDRGRVPQVAVAIVHDGRVAWTRGYGGATPDTRFQVGSISKPVAAAGLLRLVAADTPIVVRGWRAPPRLTLRQLLSHTAGLSVDGYLGLDPSRPLPSTLDQVTGRGEGPAVRAVDPPGTRLRYSGGGYAVAQLWAEQQTCEPFARLMTTEVLRPLGMTRSTFARDRPPPGALTGHDMQGRPTPQYRYAASAAAGLWSTANDVGRFAAWSASPDPIARAMREPAPATDGRWGMGVELLPLRGDRVLVEHEGINRGWHSRFVAEPRSGWGVVVLTDGDAGGPLADAVVGELVS